MAARLRGRGEAGVPLATDRPLGRDRLYRWTSLPLLDLLAIKDHCGVTFNDVVLGGLSNGVRELLLERGTTLDHHLVRTLVPVLVRHDAQRGLADDRVSAILLNLPVEIGDAHERLIEASVWMGRLKNSQQAGADELVPKLGDATPAPLLAAGLHPLLRITHRHLSTVTTNVPGPGDRLYLLGCRLVSSYPYAPLADRVRVGNAVTSYDGKLLVGVTADRDSIPMSAYSSRASTEASLSCSRPSSPSAKPRSRTARVGPG